MCTIYQKKNKKNTDTQRQYDEWAESEQLKYKKRTMYCFVLFTYNNTRRAGAIESYRERTIIIHIHRTRADSSPPPPSRTSTLICRVHYTRNDEYVRVYGHTHRTSPYGNDSVTRNCARSAVRRSPTVDNGRCGERNTLRM